MPNEDAAMRWAREQVDEFFAHAHLPDFPDARLRAHPVKAPLLACLLTTSTLFVVLMIVTFLVGR